MVDNADEADKAVAALARVGVEGVLLKGVETWREQGLPIDAFGTTSAQQVANWLQDAPVRILDVRDDMEWEEKHIPGATHIYVGYLEGQLPAIPKDSRLVVHCSVGHRRRPRASCASTATQGGQPAGRAHRVGAPRLATRKGARA